MVEPATEKVKVKLIDGTETEVLIKKFIGFRKKQQIYNKAMSGTKLKSGQSNQDLEINASNAMDIISDIAEEVWYDKNIKLDDVEGDSLYKVLTERFDTFLGSLGLSAEISNNTSS